MGTARGKVLLILPYFGPFGPWFPLYLYSLGRQHTLDLLLLTDGEPPPLPANVRVVRMTLDDLRDLATARLGLPVRLQRTRQICDLRPAYGLIFEEFCREYPYWAFGDEDMLYGDLDNVLAPHLKDGPDLVVAGTNKKRTRGAVQGPLTVIRNSIHTNQLATNDPVYSDVLMSHEHWAYDETSWRYGGDRSSFTKIVKEAEARGEVRVTWGLPSATHLPERGHYYAYDGRALRTDDGTELLYYHWGKMRYRNIQWPSTAAALNGFLFDRYGIYGSDPGTIGLVARRTVGRVRELYTDTRGRLSEWRARLSLICRAIVASSSGRRNMS